MAKLVNTNPTPRYADDVTGDHGGGVFRLKGGETVEVAKDDPLHDLLLSHPGVETDSKEARSKIEQVEVATAGHGPNAFPAEVAEFETEGDRDAEPPAPDEDHTTLPSELPGAEAVSYEDQGTVDLKAEVKRRDLEVKGSGKKGSVLKADLIEALEADDASSGTGTLTSDQVPSR